MQINRELIFVCAGSDCKKSGAKNICKELKNATSQIPFKGRFKLIRTKCMDMCKSAPLVIIKDHYCKKTSSLKVLELLKKP
jgi:NADH:ubiquinone oxidoreductase subunit E